MINLIHNVFVIKSFYGYKTIFVFSAHPNPPDQILEFKKILGGGTYNPFNKYTESGPYYNSERTGYNHIVYRTFFRKPTEELTRIKLLSDTEIKIKFLGWHPKRVIKGIIESFSFTP